MVGTGLDDLPDDRNSAVFGVVFPTAPWPVDSDGARRDLREALVALRPSREGGVISARRMIDPLLDLWSLAAAVDRTIARPIEVLLRAAVERSVITAAEVSDCVEGVEANLALALLVAR